MPSPCVATVELSMRSGRASLNEAVCHAMAHPLNDPSDTCIPHASRSDKPETKKGTT